jgi:hypothetical protein
MGFIKKETSEREIDSRSPETQRNPYRRVLGRTSSEYAFGFLAPIRFEDLLETLAGSGNLFVTGSCVYYNS